MSYWILSQAQGWIQNESFAGVRRANRHGFYDKIQRIGEIIMSQSSRRDLLKAGLGGGGRRGNACFAEEGLGQAY